MDSLPFIIPIASAVFLANAFWSFSLSCRVRHLQRRVELLEDERTNTRSQVARQQLTIAPSAPPVTTQIYYPTQQPTMLSYPPNILPPPYRPMASAPTDV